MSHAFPSYVQAVSGCSIRLSHERWLHITEGHQEMAGYFYEVLETIANPVKVYAGTHDELLAYKSLEENRYIVVVYKETTTTEGFVLTAFLTSRINYLNKRTLIWPK